VDSDTPAIVPGRACGSCTLCCKVLRIDELAKPSGTWCSKCNVGKGCSIYSERPDTCRSFLCGYLIGAQLSESWRPSKAKMVLVFDRHITVHVDPGSPTAWRNEPYYSDLKRWSSEVAAVRGNVFIAIGRRVIVVLPQGGETDLGVVGEDERILSRELPTFSGKRLEVIKIKQDDPRVGEGVDPLRSRGLSVA
jgi:hypothetical protein